MSEDRSLEAPARSAPSRSPSADLRDRSGRPRAACRAVTAGPATSGLDRGRRRLFFSHDETALRSATGAAPLQDPGTATLSRRARSRSSSPAPKSCSAAQKPRARSPDGLSAETNPSVQALRSPPVDGPAARSQRGLWSRAHLPGTTWPIAVAVGEYGRQGGTLLPDVGQKSSTARRTDGRRRSGWMCSSSYVRPERKFTAKPTCGSETALPARRATRSTPPRRPVKSSGFPS